MTTAPKALFAALLLATPVAAGRLAADDRLPRAVVASGEGVVVSGDGDTLEVEAPRALPRIRLHRMDGGSRLGISLVDLTPELRTHFGAPKDAGVLVGSVEKDSPASRAGIEVGDVVTTVDGEKFDSSWQLGRAIRRKSSGEAVTVEIIVVRKGASKKLTAKLEARPEGDRDVELHGYLDRDFGRDLSREIRRGLRDVHPYAWDFEGDGEHIRVMPRSRDLKELEAKVQSLERRLKELEGNKSGTKDR